MSRSYNIVPYIIFETMPKNEPRSHWDLKYEQGLPSMEKPDPFFLTAYGQFVADSFSNGGTALDLAGGIGRHALWLAQRNWRVTVVDISEATPPVRTDPRRNHAKADIRK
jgi:2-polyprenyl-3-methyl-5-hydroxy-6-metoxy-1,4-benzoquinol methylase